MAHYIVDSCIGCTACVQVCPTDAITGEKKGQHVIDPVLCIDCNSCTRVCPATAIMDNVGVYLERVARRSEWPKPDVNPVQCTGCEFCVSVCPFECLELNGNGTMWGTAELVKPKDCVGCALCESVCAKGAITMVKGLQVSGAA